MSPDEKNFYINEVMVSKEKAIEICLDTTSQIGTKWKTERKKRLTASSVYPLITYLSNKNANWEKKISNHLFSKFHGTSATVYGSVNEDKARQCYSSVMQCTVKTVGLIINEHLPWMACSPDGINTTHKCLLEIKCPESCKNLSSTEIIPHLSYIVKCDEGLKLKEKHTYYCQIQINLFLTCLKLCHLVIYSSCKDKCLVLPVAYDEHAIKSYVPKMKVIFFTYSLPALTKEKKTLENYK